MASKAESEAPEDMTGSCRHGADVAGQSIFTTITYVSDPETIETTDIQW